MADVITELRRPAMLGAVVFAAVGWLMLIWSFAASNSDQDALRSQLGDVQKRSVQLADELRRERDAAGSLAEMAAKREAAEAEYRRTQADAQAAARARDEAQGQLIGLTDKLKSTQGQKAEADRVTKEAIAQRDKSLGELDAARQQSDTVKQAFAGASDQLAGKNSELAALNGKLQELQASATQQAAALLEAGKRLAQTQDAAKALLAQQEAVARTVADAQSQLSSARQTLAALDAEIAARRNTLAGSPESPSQP